MRHETSNIIDMADATRGNDREPRCGRQGHSRLDIEALHHAIPIDVGINHRTDARISKALSQVSRIELAFTGPTLYRDLPAAGIDANDDVARELPAGFEDKFRVLAAMVPMMANCTPASR